MRQIIRTNKGIELSQMLEIERIWLESTATAEISMVQKMACSPVIRRHFSNPSDKYLEEIAIAEMNSFRSFFTEGYEIFWINDIDRIFYMDNAEPFLLNPDNHINYWYYMTLYETTDFNLNINYNPDLQSFNLWINAPVFDDDGKPLGILGAGIDLSAFTGRVGRSLQDRGEMFFFNDSGEITVAIDLELVKNKVQINDELADMGMDISAAAKDLAPGETRAFEVPRGEIAIGTVPLLDWFSVAFMPDNTGDYDTTMTYFFLVVLVLMLLIFIIFNVFIAGYLKSLNKTMESHEVASKAKSTFLANMSHEIRTPMNAIIGITDIMMQKETLPDEMTDGLGKIYDSCDLLLGIINDILDFSKIEAGKLDVVPARYHVASLINNSVNLNVMRIGDKPIEFELKVDENVPSKLIGDELRIKQILNNLLSNSFKYTSEGKVTLSVTSEPAPDEGGVILILNVADTGSGMTGEQLEKLFDEYTRFDRDHIRTIEGTGLGLAITQRLIYLMDGNIHVDSEPGKGTSVRIWLPQKHVDEDVLGKEIAENLSLFYVSHLTRKKRSRIEYDPMPYGRVLIVDDVETNLYVAVGLMKLYSLQIETASSGREALEKVYSGKTYDIIFMDHMMPDLDGIETTKRLREFGYANPIVALTANAVAGQASMFLKNGFDNFISKPIDIRQLDLVLIRLIREKQQPEVIEAARLDSGMEGANFDGKSMEGDDDMVITDMGGNGQGGGSEQTVYEKDGSVRSGNSGNSGNSGYIGIDPLLMESFARDINKAVTVLDKLLKKPGIEDDEDLREFTIIVHGIKSSLGNLNETELADAAFLLEQAGRDKKLELIAANTSGFIDKLRKLQSRLQTVQNNGKNEDSGEDPVDIHEKMLALKEMCVDYNRRGALSIIADVEACSAKTRAVLESIKEQVLHSDYEEAESIAAQYADELE